MEKCTAIILAAGMGRRLGEIAISNPKPLIEVGGKTLVQHAINFMNILGIKDIIVVGGYLFDKLNEVVKSIDSSIKVIENTEYELQNLLSFEKALREVNNNILVYDADHIFKKETADVVSENMKGIAIYCSYDLSGDSDDVMKVKTDDQGNLVEMSKTLTCFNAIYTGVFFIESEYLFVLRACVRDALEDYGKEHARVELIFKEFLDRGHNVRVTDIGRSDWIEIDTPEDLASATKSINSI